jgi:hypothetical protein
MAQSGHMPGFKVPRAVISSFSSRRHCRGLLLLVMVTMVASASCSRCVCTSGVPPVETSGSAFLKPLEPRYRVSMARARTWLDNLTVDPLELRGVGIKGKKKLVEQLDSYYRLWQVGSDDEKVRLLERIRQVVAITYQDRYHDMATISDRWFKQDATSYLRAAVLMERLGLDTRRYREEIKKINGRLNDHMAKRGPHQQRVFHWYYNQFGLAEPFPLGDALDSGVIARRVEPTKMSIDDVYSLTHEVYALYEYGDRLNIDPFDAASKAYLRSTIEALIRRYIGKGDPDVAGELIECIHYLRMQDSPAYANGVHFLLDSQNPDGSWGTYDRQQMRVGDYINQGLRLHTTLVAIGALTAIFERPMPPVLVRVEAAEEPDSSARTTLSK